MRAGFMVLALGLVAACSDDGGPSSAQVQKGCAVLCECIGGTGDTECFDDCTADPGSAPSGCLECAATVDTCDELLEAPCSSACDD